MMKLIQRSMTSEVWSSTARRPAPPVRGATLLGSLLLLALTPALGCGGSSDAVGGTTDVPQGSRGDDAVREQCEGSGYRVQAVDVNNDGRPDIRHVFDGDRRRCS